MRYTRSPFQLTSTLSGKLLPNIQTYISAHPFLCLNTNSCTLKFADSSDLLGSNTAHNKLRTLCTNLSILKK